MGADNASELLKTLYIVENLRKGPKTSEYLQDVIGVSRSTVNRYIAEARRLGAEIITRQRKDGWFYYLVNCDAVTNTLQTWIRLEEKRDLTIDDFARKWK